MKEALRKVKTLIEKGGNKMHQVERLSYRVVEMYVYEKSNRKQEAVNLGDEIIKEILDRNVNDQPLLDMLDQILTEMTQYEKLLQLREKIATKNPADQ